MRSVGLLAAILGAGCARARPGIPGPPAESLHRPPVMASRLVSIEGIERAGVRRTARVGLERRAELDAVAAAAATSAAADHVVAARAVRGAMAARLGSAAWPHVFTGWGSDAEIEAQLDDALLELRADGVPLAEIGSAVAEGPAGRVGVIVALPREPRLPLTIDHHGRSSEIALAWAWPEEPAAYAVTPTRALRIASRVGDPQTFASSRGLRPGHRSNDPDVRFTVDCRTPAPAVEIRAGERIVATVVDACGTTVALDDLGAEEVGPPAHTRTEIEHRVFELLNRERVAHGRPPLAWDPAVLVFARGHSAEMARHAYVGHHTHDGLALRDRIVHAPFAWSSARENVGHAWGPGEVHVAFMHSPGHRENVLAWDISRGAVGIAIDPVDPTAFYITEFFRDP
jgi:uncharacterized protein YkwD